MKRVVGSVLCVAVWAFVWSVPVEAYGQDVVKVKARGQGVDRDGAVKDALRHAIEKGGQSEIASRSKTKDFALEFDRFAGCSGPSRSSADRAGEGSSTRSFPISVSISARIASRANGRSRAGRTDRVSSRSSDIVTRGF